MYSYVIENFWCNSRINPGVILNPKKSSVNWATFNSLTCFFSVIVLIWWMRTWTETLRVAYIIKFFRHQCIFLCNVPQAVWLYLYFNNTNSIFIQQLWANSNQWQLTQQLLTLFSFLYYYWVVETFTTDIICFYGITTSMYFTHKLHRMTNR